MMLKRCVNFPTSFSVFMKFPTLFIYIYIYIRVYVLCILLFPQNFFAFDRRIKPAKKKGEKKSSIKKKSFSG